MDLIHGYYCCIVTVKLIDIEQYLRYRLTKYNNMAEKKPVVIINNNTSNNLENNITNIVITLLLIVHE